MVDEDVRLQKLSEAQGAVWNGEAHPFEITVGDPKSVKVGYAGCNLR